MTIYYLFQFPFLKKQMESNMGNDQMMSGRIRSSSDASDRQRQFSHQKTN